MANLVKTAERYLQSNKKVYMDEFAHPFKLYVVQDQKVLSGASDYRVREEFRSQLRTLHSFPEDGVPWAWASKNIVCLVLMGEQL